MTQRPRPGVSAALWGASLLSGAAALLFGAQWIREAGLGLVGAAASSVVLAAFVAGAALGRLHGWGLLGGALGALALETLLVPRLGLARTAFVAAALTLTAAVAALAIDRRLGVSAPPVEPAADEPPPRRAAVSRWRALRLLTAAFVAGGILLGLERVWAGFLGLFVFGTSLALALMLASVLAGVGVGALVAAAWLRQRPDATRVLPLLALLAGVATIASYAAFEPARAPSGGEVARTLWLSLVLMLPTSLVSGVLLGLIGADLRDELPGDAAAAGWLSLAGVLGATLGSSLAGLVLLPRIGVERALFALALAYGLLSLPLLRWSRSLPRPALYAAGGVFALVTLLFPFGLMQSRFVRRVVDATGSDGAQPVAFREGANGAAILLQTDWGGAPAYQQLITNARAEASSVFYPRRSSKLLAYWPVALRPGARRALLVGYGLGNTAEAMLRAPDLQRIDVVEASRTILELSPLAARGGAADPLGDRRVHAHVEEARSFMRAAAEPYDVIAVEPGPPQAAGGAGHYSLEYFRLTRSRLAAGGIATHRLPVSQLPLAGAQAVAQAFCLAFEDCSLWSGAGYEWFLVGSNGAEAPAEAGVLAAVGRGLVRRGPARDRGRASRAAGGLVRRRRRAARAVDGGRPAARRRPAGPRRPWDGDTRRHRGVSRVSGARGLQREVPGERPDGAALACGPARAERRVVRLASCVQPRLRGGGAPAGARRALGGAGGDIAHDAAAAAAG